MKKWLLAATLLFSLLIIAIIIGADAHVLPGSLQAVYVFPNGDKAGHFILYGILSFLLNKSALTLLHKRRPARLVLTVSLLLAILIGLEEWSQSLFTLRTMDIVDLLASYAGVAVFALLAYRTLGKDFSSLPSLK